MNTPAPRETLRAEDVRRWNRPFVYGWRRGDHYLYIGVTKRGLPRLNDNLHPIHIAGGFQSDDVIDLWDLLPGIAPFALERLLIEALKPALNGTLRRIVHGTWSARDQNAIARVRAYLDAAVCGNGDQR